MVTKKEQKDLIEKESILLKRVVAGFTNDETVILKPEECEAIASALSCHIAVMRYDVKHRKDERDGK